ncbi:MAG: PRTRC system protein A [Gammaproteobacteria bacterium]|nr:PRTRC system protein A [Gammaproteobacteria bacterium]MBU1978980.1 PRTRC system protein A [Gammaproteobacteria bacterium]
MDSRDVALQSVMPTVMVPCYSELEELATAGDRILMAANGVWLEVCRAWLYARVLVAKPSIIPVPYGQVSEVMRFGFGKLPRAMVAQFIEQARARCPNECAAWVVWNQRTNEWRLMMLEETSVGPGHVNVNLPTLEEDEHMVMDLHSHGLTEAFFSRTDNKDDRGATKIAGVIGNLDKPEATASFRLCANGVFVPLPFDNPQVRRYA